MNEQTKTIIDRARALLVAATPRPWLASNDAEPVRVVSGMMAGYHKPGSRFVCGHEAGGHAHPVSPVDAELIAFAVNNIGTLCDALESAHTREANALKACLCGHHGECAWCRIEYMRVRSEAADAHAAAYGRMVDTLVSRVKELSGSTPEIEALHAGQLSVELRVRQAERAAAAGAPFGWTEKLEASQAGRIQQANRADAAQAEVDVLRQKLAAAEATIAATEADRKMRAESADPEDETWNTRAEYLGRIRAEAECTMLQKNLTEATKKFDVLALTMHDQWTRRVEALTQDLEATRRERDAYKRAKSEKDDRFMRERDEARDECDTLRRKLREAMAQTDEWSGKWVLVTYELHAALVRERDSRAKKRVEDQDEAELRAGIEQERLKVRDALQKVCTLAADHVPIARPWSTDKTPRPWGCIIGKPGGYCDDCPVRDICPFDRKQWSK